MEICLIYKMFAREFKMLHVTWELSRLEILEITWFCWKSWWGERIFITLLKSVVFTTLDFEKKWKSDNVESRVYESDGKNPGRKISLKIQLRFLLDFLLLLLLFRCYLIKNFYCVNCYKTCNVLLLWPLRNN